MQLHLHPQEDPVPAAVHHCQAPTIIGPQTAVVVGPKGEDIYTDSLGRVKWCSFRGTDSASAINPARAGCAWGQPWAGSGFGMVNIPRIGDEVVVIFLDGDPDRPLIISRVYNAQNMAAVGLAGQCDPKRHSVAIDQGR
ncbi:phage baseplate assembly protein V [Burkholderia multivorans]|uniref:phage baseplate assembly protein V n=1 Tax=Burkholderia multivorans TaxID=87883 RepID=UPI00201B2A39|nr:phage baseplate assembly protein V [Burkholderia multivorans]MCL4662499.1 phage baseplate assembly protein V [Burkholderia multivorans]